MKLRRTIFKCICFLALGAVINILVAWTFALFAPFWNYSTGYETSKLWTQSDFDWWIAHFPYDPTQVHWDELNQETIFVAPHQLGVSFTMLHTHGRYAGHYPTEFGVRRVRSGFPCDTMEASCWSDSTSYHLKDGIQCSPPTLCNGGDHVSFLYNGRYVPLRPLFPGLLINTLFYALLCWLLASSPGAVKRFIRRRRNLCVNCAYPVGSSPTCTECGFALKPANQTRTS